MGTTAHGIWWPDDYNLAADLPVLMQQNAQSVEDALVKQDLDEAAALAAAVPIGAIIAYGGATAPSSWHLCDGSAHGSSALQTVLGSANTPDLRNRFVVGVGSNYARGATGGADAVGLTAAQSGMPSHDHAASASPTDTTHAHSIPSIVVMGTYNGANQDGAVGISASFTMTPNSTQLAGGAHTHNVSVGMAAAQNAAQAHENRPPFYALTYIIRKA